MEIIVCKLKSNFQVCNNEKLPLRWAIGKLNWRFIRTCYLIYHIKSCEQANLIIDFVELPITADFQLIQYFRILNCINIQ